MNGGFVVGIMGCCVCSEVGQFNLLELINIAKKQLGDDFDIIEFHHAVLSQGALPLAVLEENIETYLLEVK